MSLTREDVFGLRTPPPGGLAGLRERLQAQRRRRLLWTGVLLGPVALATTAVLLVLPARTATVHFSVDDNPALLRARGGSPSSQSVTLRDANDALLQVSSDERVDFYWVVPNAADGH